MTAGPETIRVLVADSEPGLLGDYRRALDPGAGAQDLELSTCRSAARALGEGRPFAVVFIDPPAAADADGLAPLAELRALDPEVYLVVVTARPDLRPAELCARVAPAERLHYLQKPFHGAELQQLALALGAAWRARRAPEPAAALERHPAGVLLFDRDDRLSAANRAMHRLFPELADRLDPGRGYEAVQRRIAARLLPEDTVYRTGDWLRERMAWHRAGGGVLEQRLRGGRWLLLAEARDAQGATTCHFTDISELKRREAERDAAARTTQMAQAFAGLCERFFVEPGALERQAAGGKVVSLRPHAEAAARLRPAGAGPAEIHSLSDKLRAVAQRQKLLPGRFDLNREVAELARRGRDLLPASIELEVVAGTGLWPVMIDGGKLALALRELIQNAGEAVIGRGRLTVETANVRLPRDSAAARAGPVGDCVRLSVSDDGPGMAPELAARAFNPFFGTKGKGAHLGLGLSVVQGFACQSGGRAEITGNRRGGTTVALYFPRARTASGTAAAPGGAGRSHSGDSP
jgi:signal transduction histidine kinase